MCIHQPALLVCKLSRLRHLEVSLRSAMSGTLPLEIFNISSLLYVAGVASLDELQSELAIELVDNDLREWQFERFEEDGPGRPFDRRKGKFRGPKIGDYLRHSGAVKVVSGDAGAAAPSGSARSQREKLGNRAVASARVGVCSDRKMFTHINITTPVQMS